MSTTNLFDLPEINTGNEQPEDNFFDKLDAVEVDYSSLGPTIVNAIKFWSDSYLKKIEYYDDLLKFKKEYWAKAKEGKSTILKRWIFLISWKTLIIQCLTIFLVLCAHNIT